MRSPPRNDCDGATSPPARLLGASRNQATVQGFRRFPAVIATAKAVEPASAQSSVDVVATPYCDRPDTIGQRTAEECGRCAAYAVGMSAKTHAAGCRGYCAGCEIRPLDSGHFLACILREKALTMTAPEAYISPLGAPPLDAMACLEKPLTVCAVNHPASPWPRRMCGLRRLLPRFLRPSRGQARWKDERRGHQAPGCLTSESEERETWTAESLRTASSNGEDFGFLGKRAVMEETSAVLRFKVFYTVDCANGQTCRDLVKRCDQPRSYLSST